MGEDVALALELQCKGHRSCYLHECLAVGEVPTDIRAICMQKSRWDISIVLPIAHSTEFVSLNLKYTTIRVHNTSPIRGTEAKYPPTSVRSACRNAEIQKNGMYQYSAIDSAFGILFLSNKFRGLMALIWS